MYFFYKQKLAELQTWRALKQPAWNALDALMDDLAHALDELGRTLK
jgi:hypothetical protein